MTEKTTDMTKEYRLKMPFPAKVIFALYAVIP